MANLSNSIEPVSGQPFLATGINAALTMSSRQIAELCEKQHKHVLRDVEKMIQDIDQPNFGPVDFEAQYQDGKGEWRKEYRLPEDLVVTLITGYRADLRYRVVKELEQLRREKRYAVPEINVRDQSQLTQIAIQLIEVNQDQARQIESMRDDVQAHERISKAEGSLNVTEAAKNLGMRPGELFDWLSHNGWIYKRAGSKFWLGYQPRCNAGDLVHKSTTVLRSDGSEKISEQVRVTPQGLAKLAKLIFPQAKLIGGTQ